MKRANFNVFLIRKRDIQTLSRFCFQFLPRLKMILNWIVIIATQLSSALAHLTNFKAQRSQLVVVVTRS